MINLEIARVHLDQLTQCNCRMLSNLQQISRRARDPEALVLVNNSLKELQTIVSEDAMLRSSLKLPSATHFMVLRPLTLRPPPQMQRGAVCAARSLRQSGCDNLSIA